MMMMIMMMTIRGVRAIMAARSKVFLSMLFGDRWLEQQGEAIPMPENGPVAKPYGYGRGRL